MLPTIAPRGCWAEAEYLLGETIAACEETWAFLGVRDADEAKASNMWLHAMPPPRDDEEYDRREYFERMFPAIVIATPGDDADTFRLYRQSSPLGFGAIGMLEARFYKLPPESETIADQERLFINSVGVILEQATAFGDTNGFLDIQELTVQEFGRESQEGEDVLGDLQVAIVQVPWGVFESGSE